MRAFNVWWWHKCTQITNYYHLSMKVNGSGPFQKIPFSLLLSFCLFRSPPYNPLLTNWVFCAGKSSSFMIRISYCFGNNFRHWRCCYCYCCGYFILYFGTLEAPFTRTHEWQIFCLNAWKILWMPSTLAYQQQ